MDTERAFFRVPGLEKQKAYNFDASDRDIKIYEELNAINEEIERCRSRNSLA